MSGQAYALMNKVGWTLVHFTWQGVVLGLATAMLLALMRKARPEQRYVVACSALFLCLAWPALGLYQRLQSPALEFFDPTFGATLAGTNTQAGLLALLQAHLLWIVGLWALCAALLALRMALGLLWVARAAARHPGHPEWQDRIDRMASSWGIARKVRLCIADGLASPVTAGWLRPVVILPAALVTGMPHQLLEALLAHEMAHIRRFDYLVNVGQNVVETLLFYHPAVWWISGRIRIEREQIADDLAAAHLTSPRTLALALSELEKLQFSGRHLAVAANGGDLAARIRRLLRPGAQGQSWKAALPLLALALGCAAIVAGARPAATQAVVHKAVARFSSCAKPAYPEVSIRAGQTGTVVLNFLVSADGTVRESTIEHSSGFAPLDSAARDAISLCSFSPATRNGEAIASWTRVQYVWRLA